MKWKILIPVALVALVAAGGIAMSQMNAPVSPTAKTTSSTAGTGAVLPVTTNPITNTSTMPGMTIVSAAAEDNVDSAGTAITDRLQITIRNTTGNPLTNLETYYVMKDTTTAASEAYYLPLDGLTLAPNAETTISFDNETGAGHFPENTFSLYRSSTNQVDFTIQVSANGVQIANGTATKGAGTGEQAD